MSRAMREIVARVADTSGVPVSEIMGRRRLQPIARIRQHSYRIMREEGRSLARIGAFFGRDHTTVLHGIRRDMERKMAPTAPERPADAQVAPSGTHPTRDAD